MVARSLPKALVGVRIPLPAGKNYEKDILNTLFLFFTGFGI